MTIFVNNGYYLCACNQPTGSLSSMIKNGKEYPATHSMSTSWFFVDKDDSVAIFDFEDNGPIPESAKDTADAAITDLCFSDYAVEKDGLLTLPYTDQQVEDTLEGLWETEVKDDKYWSDEIFQIDTARESEFFEYLKECRSKTKKDKWGHKFEPICLSRKLGIYFLDLDSYDYGYGFSNKYAKYLFDNKLVLRYCDCPYYDGTIEDWKPEKRKGNECVIDVQPNCPFYLYFGEYDPRIPHEVVSIPKHPVKLSQLPQELREKIVRLNLRFADTPVIQITHECLCYSSVGNREHIGILFTESGDEYIEVKMPDGSLAFVLNDNGNNDTDLPLVPSEEMIERLKQLAINKDFQSVAIYYDND